MTADHQSVIDQAVALVKKLGVTPMDNDISKKLNAGAETTTKMLREKTATTFDKAYIDNEVAYHKAVIETVQNVLIPQTKNGELKALLEKVLPILKTHLSHAEMVQKMITK
jgi:putative membrane protein